MVNSKSDLLGIFTEKDKIEFNLEIVEIVYKFLSFKEKYNRDENGDLWKLDPVGVVRSVIERSEYQLESFSKLFHS